MLIWPPGGTPSIARIFLLASFVDIELVSPSARVTSVKLNQTSHSLTDGHPDPTIGPQVYLGPIKIGFILHFRPFLASKS